MSSWYLDTSAALKLLVEEAESAALAALLDESQPQLVACWLLETELRRATHRLPALSQEAVSEFLTGIDLYEVPGAIFREAGLLPGDALRSLDALHLAVAVRLDVDHVVTYDRRMAEAARALGVRIAAPGA
ncbi:type II toxin-antitoxin system VapC family toxin [Nocardioides nanhaiensis]|uniref:Ribonuclease VapC n=1 Tax=Nocardioides nanhaiensis TaxID=1476871 RepID=A0ABP8W8F6_9ACTN